MSTSLALPAHDPILASPSHPPTPRAGARGTRRLFENSEQRNSITAIYLSNATAYLGPIATEDLAMFTRHTNDRFATSVLAGLAIVAIVAIASLTHAVANIQVVA